MMRIRVVDLLLIETRNYITMVSGNVNDILNRVRILLSQDKPQEALEAVSPHLRSRSKLIVNAYAACLMRLGHHEKAANILRDLVYQGSSLAITSDLPTVVKTNFATALLLTHKVDGAESILDQLDETKDNTTARLKAAVARWNRSLTFFQRLQCLWGTPDVPVAIDFAPGEV
jgi:thioredoxin-like negative regulator of GroEL